MSHFTTLGEFVIDRQKDFPGSSGELSRILSAIRLASKIVNQEINKAGVATHILGAAGSENIRSDGAARPPPPRSAPVPVVHD